MARLLMCFLLFLILAISEVLSTGSPHSLTSWHVLHRNRTYGGFVDAVCDKAFVVPCWIALLSSVPKSGMLHWLQYGVLICLMLAETASGTIRFRAYFTSGGVPAPKVDGFDFSTSAVKVSLIRVTRATCFYLTSIIRLNRHSKIPISRLLVLLG